MICTGEKNSQFFFIISVILKLKNNNKSKLKNTKSQFCLHADPFKLYITIHFFTNNYAIICKPENRRHYFCIY